MRRSFATAAVCAAAVALSPAPSEARDTFHDYDIERALQSAAGAEKLLSVPIYFADQSHPAVASDLGVFTANRRVNAFGRSDEESCQSAFLSAVISLQRRAEKQGGNAVVEIKSITKHQDLESKSQYRCVAGAVVANVALTGRVVSLGE